MGPLNFHFIGNIWHCNHINPQRKTCIPHFSSRRHWSWMVNTVLEIYICCLFKYYTSPHLLSGWRSRARLETCRLCYGPCDRTACHSSALPSARVPLLLSYCGTWKQTSGGGERKENCQRRGGKCLQSQVTWQLAVGVGMTGTRKGEH